MDEVADYIIKSLRVLDQEYDTLVKQAEEVYQQDQHIFEARTYQKEDNQVFVNDVVEDMVTTVDNVERRVEEIKLARKIKDIEELVRISQKERVAHARKFTVLERRLNVEKMKMDTLNNFIKDNTCTRENVAAIQEELQTVMHNLESLTVSENLYPSVILELFATHNDLQERIKNLEDTLSKYADLPPDYAQARDKLAEAQLIENELQKQIRKAIKHK